MKYKDFNDWYDKVGSNIPDKKACALECWDYILNHTESEQGDKVPTRKCPCGGTRTVYMWECKNCGKWKQEDLTPIPR